MPKELHWTIKVEPMGAPRMTRRDKWAKRPVVLRYHKFRDTVRAAVGPIESVPDVVHCIFHLPMPESWSTRKRVAMCGKPHRQRPDKDNIEKGVLDALFDEDGAVWGGSQQKLWAESGSIYLTMIWH